MPTTKEEKDAGLVSVSEVLNYFTEPSLVDWKVKTGAKESARISRLAAKTGSRVHELIYKNWKEGSYKLSKTDNSEVKSCMEAWERFDRDYSPKIIDMERILECKELGLIGHLDIIAEIGGVLHILDIKTSGRISKKHWVQLGAYHLMENEYIAKKVAIVRLDRNIGTYEFVVEEPRHDVFLALIRVYDFFNERAYGQGEQHDSSSSTKDSPSDK